MYRRGFSIVGIAVLLASTLGVAIAEPFKESVGSSTLLPLEPTVDSLSMFRAPKFDAHYRMPNTDQIGLLLKKKAVLLDGSQATERALQDFRRAWIKRNPTTVNPQKLRELLERERSAEPGPMALGAAAPQIKSLVVPVEFPNTDTFDWCGTSVTQSGPLHNQIAPPGPRDNNTVWYEDTTPAMFNELYFGVGPKAGVIVHHPNLGVVDLRGNTMANYYLEQSGGKFVPTGQVYPKWLQADHSEGWYGADGCDGGSHNVRAPDLVREAIDLVNADNPAFAWQNFDGNADGIVDNFTVIHAGVGQEAGGGAQGNFAIWSHASMLNWPTGYKACTRGSAGCPDRDIYVLEYSMDPENIDIGVIAEEFGHAAFGLPDIYATDAQASPSNWAIFEAGSWNGPLGGMQPAPFPLWARMVVGWATPPEVDYTTAHKLFKVGQHSLTPKGTKQGIRINLPDQQVTTPNKLATGQAWWSDAGDRFNTALTRSFDLVGRTAPVFSFQSTWGIETDWDYGYVEVSENNGVTWTTLRDTTGFFTNTDPNGNNQGWGLTGEVTVTHTLSFDLAAYNGTQILIRLRYSTDSAVTWQGWWADDFALIDGDTTVWVDNVEGEAGGWTVNGWQTVPLTRTYPVYYLVEWRNASGFDRGLAYPYLTVYYSEDEWEVDRCPYTVPGMLLWLRNTLYGFDYTLNDSTFDPPSMGPKHALLVVDSHYWPTTWSNYTYSSGAKLRINARCQPADAPFTLQETTPFTLRLGYDPSNSQYVNDPLETKAFGPREAVPQFHDSLGYTPGLWYRPATGGLYYWHAEASAVVPAEDNYTTRITDLNQNPLLNLYGATVGNTSNVLGSGDPGDSNVQYGLHLAVVQKAKDGSWGQIAVWNSEGLTKLEVKVNLKEVFPGKTLVYQFKVKNATRVAQSFTVRDPLPANTQYQKGNYYNPATNSIEWSGTVAPGGVKVGQVWVTVNPDTPAGTVIVNTATLSDDALGGGSASVTTTVKAKPTPH
jgi:immune inhibitor A